MVKITKAEFEMEKELLKIDLENARFKHEFHLKELTMQKELEALKHDKECERIRIKSAEVRKSQMRSSY